MLGLGWRVHASTAVVVAVRGAASAPAVVHREEVSLLAAPELDEPYHACVGRPVDEAEAFLVSAREAAAATAHAAIERLVSSLGSVRAVGVVGGDRKLPVLARILTKHALLHAGERALYEAALVEGATRAGLPVTTIPASGTLFDDASDVVGVAVTPVLAAVGKAIGPPWQKEYREAAAAALVALARAR